MNLEFRVLRPDSGVGWLELHGKAYTQRSGSSARLVAVVKDVTERKLLDDRLRQANVAYETTIDSIFILDVNRRIISANPAFATLTGYEIDEVLNRDPDEFLHARGHSDHFYAQLEALSEARWQGEIDCRRKSARGRSTESGRRGHSLRRRRFRYYRDAQGRAAAQTSGSP